MAVIVAVGVFEAGLLVWAVGALRRMGQVEERLTQLTDALTLLSETTESGFRAAALELGRLAEQPSLLVRPPASELHARVELPVAPETRPLPARPRRQPRQTRQMSVDQLPPVSEKSSRGEARLRLHMAEQAAPARAAAGRGGDNGALRA